MVVVEDRYLSGHARPFIAELGVEAKDEELLVGCEGSLLEVGAEVVGPTEAAALAAARQPAVPLHRIPVPLPVPPHMLHQDRVLCRRPRPLLQPPFCLLPSSFSFLGLHVFFFLRFAFSSLLLSLSPSFSHTLPTSPSSNFSFIYTQYN